MNPLKVVSRKGIRLNTRGMFIERFIFCNPFILSLKQKNRCFLGFFESLGFNHSDSAMTSCLFKLSQNALHVLDADTRNVLGSRLVVEHFDRHPTVIVGFN